MFLPIILVAHLTCVLVIAECVLVSRIKKSLDKTTNSTKSYLGCYKDN
jgi:hypothetical protein